MSLFRMNSKRLGTLNQALKSTLFPLGLDLDASAAQSNERTSRLKKKTAIQPSCLPSLRSTVPKDMSPLYGDKYGLKDPFLYKINTGTPNNVD